MVAIALKRATPVRFVLEEHVVRLPRQPGEAEQVWCGGMKGVMLARLDSAAPAGEAEQVGRCGPWQYGCPLAGLQRCSTAGALPLPCLGPTYRSW